MGANTYRLMSDLAAGEMPDGTDEFSADGKRVITGSTSRTSVIAAIPSRELLPDGVLRRIRP